MTPIFRSHPQRLAFPDDRKLPGTELAGVAPIVGKPSVDAAAQTAWNPSIETGVGAAPLAITAVVISKNEADRIGRCVASLTPLCNEVIVLDSGSTDDTVAVAKAAGAKVSHLEWQGYAAQKNAAIAMARNEWVLLLDSDEWLGERASSQIADLFASKKVQRADVWQLKRRTHYLGEPLRFGGWGREAVARLFRSRFRYKPARVHESLDLKGARIRNCNALIEHDTARSSVEYKNKLETYAQLFAEQRHGQGKHASFAAPLVHAFFYAFKNGVLRGGVFDGPRGWQFHAAHTYYVWNKYQILLSWSRPIAFSQTK